MPDRVRLSAGARGCVAAAALGLLATAVPLTHDAEASPLAKSGSATGAATSSASPPGYLTILLGRALYADAEYSGGCQIPPGMMTIDQVVPQMAALGIHPTAAVIPARTPET